MSEKQEGFWWVRLGPGIRSEALGDGPRGSWRVLWAYGDSLMTHDPRDGGEFVAMKERAAEWGPYLGTEPHAELRAVARRLRKAATTPITLAMLVATLEACAERLEGLAPLRMEDGER